MNKDYTYRWEVDQIEKEEWSCLLRLFDDATILQTWDFATVFPGRRASRLVLRRGGEVVGLAQVRIATLPFVSRGIAHLVSGPLWRRQGTPLNPEIFEVMLEALYEEFVVRQSLLLRIIPNISTDDSTEPLRALCKVGFSEITHARKYHTIIVDISRPMPEILKSFDRDWRNRYRAAERKSLEVRQSTIHSYYEEFLPIYYDMLDDKGFETEMDAARWARLQGVLPETEKPRIFIAYHEGKAVSGLIVSGIGKTGAPILAATHPSARKLSSSYVLYWRAIEWLKEMGCQYLDLVGIDPEKAPGTYHFKKAFAGQEISFIGSFESCESPLSSMIVKLGEIIRIATLKIIRAYKRKILFRKTAPAADSEMSRQRCESGNEIDQQSSKR